MVTIELTKEETNEIIKMMSSATVQVGLAEKALALLNKFKEAK